MENLKMRIKRKPSTIRNLWMTILVSRENSIDMNRSRLLSNSLCPSTLELLKSKGVVYLLESIS